MEYLRKIILPFLAKKRQELNLEQAAKALLIFDVLKGQTTFADNEMVSKKTVLSYICQIIKPIFINQLISL